MLYNPGNKEESGTSEPQHVLFLFHGIHTFKRKVYGKCCVCLRQHAENCLLPCMEEPKSGYYLPDAVARISMLIRIDMYCLPGTSDASRSFPSNASYASIPESGVLECPLSVWLIL